MNKWVCYTHCNAGENFGSCKYGHEDCPALEKDSPHERIKAQLIEEWKIDVAENLTLDSFWGWADRFMETSDLWNKMYDEIYAEIEKEEAKGPK